METNPAQTVTITFAVDGATFESNPIATTADTLRKVADQLENRIFPDAVAGDDQTIHDENGNNIGRLVFS